MTKNEESNQRGRETGGMIYKLLFINCFLLVCFFVKIFLSWIYTTIKRRQDSIYICSFFRSFIHIFAGFPLPANSLSSNQPTTQQMWSTDWLVFLSTNTTFSPPSLYSYSLTYRQFVIHLLLLYTYVYIKKQVYPYPFTLLLLLSPLLLNCVLWSFSFIVSIKLIWFALYIHTYILLRDILNINRLITPGVALLTSR